jgi:hypothetical protein
MVWCGAWVVRGWCVGGVGRGGVVWCGSWVVIQWGVHGEVVT